MDREERRTANRSAGVGTDAARERNGAPCRHAAALRLTAGGYGRRDGEIRCRAGTEPHVGSRRASLTPVHYGRRDGEIRCRAEDRVSPPDAGWREPVGILTPDSGALRRVVQ